MSFFAHHSAHCRQQNVDQLAIPLFSSRHKIPIVQPNFYYRFHILLVLLVNVVFNEDLDDDGSQ